MPTTETSTNAEKLTMPTPAPGADTFGALANTVVLQPSVDQIGPAKRLMDLVLRPPTVRQWFDSVSAVNTVTTAEYEVLCVSAIQVRAHSQGTLYREAVPRIPARVEVFFDLVFIGLINRLGRPLLG